MSSTTLSPKDVGARVLPADVFDALELSSHAYDGIGQPDVWLDNAPCCILGHMRWATDTDPDSSTDALEMQLFSVGVNGRSSDDAVRNINFRKGLSSSARVTFAEWCEELNVIRGN